MLLWHHDYHQKSWFLWYIFSFFFYFLGFNMAQLRLIDHKHVTWYVFSNMNGWEVLVYNNTLSPLNNIVCCYILKKGSTEIHRVNEVICKAPQRGTELGVWRFIERISLRSIKWNKESLFAHLVSKLNSESWGNSLDLLFNPQTS